MKKLIKNEICGSMNSAYMHCSRQKVNICGYCSLNSNCNTPKRVKKKKKKRNKTQLGNADLESKHTLSQFVFSQVTIRSKGHFLFFILFNFFKVILRTLFIFSGYGTYLHLNHVFHFVLILIVILILMRHQLPGK